MINKNVLFPVDTEAYHVMFFICDARRAEWHQSVYKYWSSFFTQAKVIKSRLWYVLTYKSRKSPAQEHFDWTFLYWFFHINTIQRLLHFVQAVPKRTSKKVDCRVCFCLFYIVSSLYVWTDSLKSVLWCQEGTVQWHNLKNIDNSPQMHYN